MKKNDLEKIIEYFNSIYVGNGYEIESINHIYSIIGKNPEDLKRENFLYEKFFDNIKEIILEITEKLSKADRKYFISKLPTFARISILDDNKKLEYIDKLNTKEKYLLIISLQDDSKKIENLDEIESEYDRSKIIQTIKSDEEKIRLLENINEPSNKVRIIESIKDDNKKINLLDSIQSEINKVSIINSMQDESKKLEAIKKIDEKLYEEYIKLINFSKEIRDGKVRKTRHKYKKLGLPENMTIGIEIEAEGVYGELLPKKIGNWDVKEEISLDLGKECTSPIMHDTDTYIYQIYKINEILKKMGMKITPKCGGHVHIGADYIKTEEGFKELLELWGNAEKIYYLISNKPGELPREGVEEYAAPISEMFKNDDLTKKDCFIEDAKQKQSDRYKSLNLMNVNNGKNTIEFRLSNGTLDGNIWIENIHLYGRTVQIAEELGKIKEKINEGKELTEEEKRKYTLKEMLKDERPIDEKMEILMQILFTEEEAKIYIKRYKSNKKREEKRRSMRELEFDKVDFQKVYESVKIKKELLGEFQEGEEETEAR